MYGPSRYLCDVLEEMRTCVKTLNFALIPSLIEECQTLGNRMEAALQDAKGVEHIRKELAELKRERKTLKKEIHKLTEERLDLQTDNGG